MATNRDRIVRVNAERSWTPAQIVALILGVAFVVLGGVALLRTGIGVDLFEPTTTVAGMSYTPLLGIIEVAFGLLMLAAGAFPGASDGVVFLGVLALAFGLLLVIEPAAFNESIAAGQAHGWFYVIAGGIAALTGLVTPSVQRRRYETREYDRGHHDERPVFSSRDERGDDRHTERTERTERIDLTSEERARRDRTSRIER